MSHSVSIAHLHHAYENYHRLGATSEAFKIAMFSSTFQFCYTTIFGWYASFVFLRTASIWPPILCHSFCNVMGFPDISEINEKRPLERKGKYNIHLTLQCISSFPYSHLVLLCCWHHSLHWITLSFDRTFSCGWIVLLAIKKDMLFIDVCYLPKCSSSLSISLDQLTSITFFSCCCC